MIFESLHDSNEHGELLLLDGGYCRWHRRRDNTITIYEILSQRPGVGAAMLARLIAENPAAITARCPADLPSNEWYRRRGFICILSVPTRSGRMLNTWRLDLANNTE